MQQFEIDGRAIGPGQSPYIIAEMSGNHNGDINRAIAILEAAKAAGADAVKLQTYTADTITIDCDRPEFRITGGLWDGKTLHDLYEWAHTPWDWHPALFDKARDLGITVFSSPFDPTAVDLLEKLQTPAYKIASFEAMDIPLIEQVAATGKPVIISTGVINRDEIGEAVAAVMGQGNDQCCVLHCVSAYPARPEDYNLTSIPALADAFGCMVGLSDHTPGTAVASTAIALGAVVVEKHLTLARADGGPDAAFSLEPDELKELVDACRIAHSALGRNALDDNRREGKNSNFRRSLYAVADIAAGEAFSSGNVRSIRPGSGLPPKHLPEILTRKARENIKFGTPLTWELVD